MKSRFYTHSGGLFYDYRRVVTNFRNEHFDNEEWLCVDFYFLSVRFRKYFWHVESLYHHEQIYYDGHTAVCLTFLGVTFCKGYSYDSRPLAKWSAEELSVLSVKREFA